MRDPNLDKVFNWQKAVNFFDICKIDETKHSSIISWLLSPQESHNLGDAFCKCLLKKVKENFVINKGLSGGDKAYAGNDFLN